MSLESALKQALQKYMKREKQVDEVTPAALDAALKRIKSVLCHGSDLTEYVSAALEDLDSNDTKIFKMGFDVMLSPEVTSAPDKKKSKTLVSLGDVLSKKVVKKKFLKQLVIDLDVDPSLDVQICDKLYSIFEEIDLGYADNKQKKALETNAQHLKNSLCFIQKFWKVLVRAEFPIIPDSNEDFSESKLLNALTETTRKKKSS